MPGRKKTAVTALFKDVKGEGFKTFRVKCIFCSTVLSKNGTRMVKHIKSCMKCTDDIKKKYLRSEKYEGATSFEGMGCESEIQPCSSICVETDSDDSECASASPSSTSLSTKTSIRPTSSTCKRSVKRHKGTYKEFSASSSTRTTPADDKKIPAFFDRLSAAQNVSTGTCTLSDYWGAYCGIESSLFNNYKGCISNFY